MLTWSATRIADAIKRKEVTSLDAVEAHIDQIERVNPKLNAVVRDRFAEARVEAKEADEALASRSPDDLPLLHGVPCTIKEAFALTGMPNCSGLASRADLVSESDATTVARLRAAGAIPMGVTNTSELCMWMESSNRVYGRTNNPYDQARIAGGSSGGEGAIVGAGASPFGLGSDIGGSIRMPAFFNGVFGHKPTGGLVPGTGQFPVSENDALRYLTTGPICRKAEDLWPLLELLAGPDGEDAVCIDFDLGDPKDVELSKLNVFSIPSNGFRKVSTDLRDAQRRAANSLVDLGARVKWLQIEKLKRSLDIWSALMSASADTTFAELLGDGTPIRWLPAMGRWVTGRSPHTLPALTLVLLEKGQAAMPGRTEKFVKLGAELKRQLEDLLGDDGVLLFPSYTSPAPRHHLALVPPINWVYTAIFNVLEFPATQVPLGLNDKGLPLGVQVAAAPGNDHLTIAVAMELERIFGGWVPPDLVPSDKR